MDSFQENVKKWVQLDSQLKTINEKAKELRTQRSELSDGIFDFVDDNNLSTSTIKISDGRLKFAQNKQTSPITLGFLETCLGEIINNDTQVTQIMEYIKQQREVKLVPDIKRYYNN
ncbi:hypothetical protein N8261_04545 [Flavobacteriaceae bacterium]|nr:hypothetical protein [Flavobacteriaceae bacterium]|tara:strand:+ start:262 stop:609 length:348 start_codon:yes stop_codon:yes gene_type:complete